MRFGTFVPQGWKMDLVGVPVEAQWERITSTAAAIEDAGYDSIWVYDHFHTHPVPSQDSVFEAWTLMAALAVTTSRARLGQMCTCIPYRSPSLLAKMAVSVDAMCGGRLDVGIGAGWSTHEFRGYGYPYPSDGERLDMLEEAAQVLIAMWTEDEAHFVGEHYVLGGAITHPRSMQDPHPPLWIAGVASDERCGWSPNTATSPMCRVTSPRSGTSRRCWPGTAKTSVGSTATSGDRCI